MTNDKQQKGKLYKLSESSAKDFEFLRMDNSKSNFKEDSAFPSTTKFDRGRNRKKR